MAVNELNHAGGHGGSVAIGTGRNMQMSVNLEEIGIVSGGGGGASPSVTMFMNESRVAFSNLKSMAPKINQLNSLKIN